MNAFEFAWYAALLFLLFGAFFVFIHMLGGWLLRPQPSKTTNLDAYECGEPPVGDAWAKFNNRFWTIAIIFVIFDVEAVFFFPIAAGFNDLMAAGRAEIAFMEVFLFVAVLGVALAYVWAKGDINYYTAEAESGYEEEYVPHEYVHEEFDASEFVSEGHH